MKRFVLVAGMLVLLFAVGSFAMQGSAEDTAVPVLQTQVADLQTRVAALEGEHATPVTSASPATGDAGSAYFLKGDPFAVTDAMVLGDKPYRTSFACSGNPLGFATMYDENGIAEVISDGSSIIQVDAGTYWFDVTCNNEWSLTIAPLMP